MRIWSIHPKYLDSKGLVALWRETLLAKHVLSGKTKGYLNHPQLDRFKKLRRPVDAIDQYLEMIYREAESRGFHFDETKFDRPSKIISIPLKRGQLKYEMNHLLAKLKSRDPGLYAQLRNHRPIKAHPIFRVVNGGIENWEIIK